MSEGWAWFAKTLVKSGCLGLPALIGLLVWRRRGIQSTTFYLVTWASPILHLLWLVAIAVMLFLDGSSKYRSLIWQGSLIANMVFFPFVLALFSLTTGVISIGARTGDRRFAVFVSALMTVLWLSVVVAPN